MSTNLSPGFYDLLHTVELHNQLHQHGLFTQSNWAKIESSELPQRLAYALARELSSFFAMELSNVKEEDLLQAVNHLFDSSSKLIPFLKELRPQAIQSLQQIKSAQPFQARAATRPDTPLSISALLTGSSRSPALRTQLIKELASADQVDWLVSFIRYSGLRPLLEALNAFTSTPNPNGSPRLRIATTSYMGATEYKAIATLLELPNTEVRISYDTKRTRLHAKAYIFHRDTGFGSAYIGSANISKAALDDGLEWTAKISQYEADHLWQHAIATFESHWADDTEFTVCKKDDLPRLKEALQQEHAKGSQHNVEELPFFDLRPYNYQRVILDDIQDERNAGKTRHLVIAATGTGKTMIAAFDYKRFASTKPGMPKLLYIAHREEILKQARAAFRQVLRDGSFGEIVAGGAMPGNQNHLFCTVQSWNSKAFNRLAPNHFDYVVLDEAHHAIADSYQALINHVKPLSLLGLTATPERADGQDIRNDFGGAFTHEIRLPEAVERALLVPFHYFGVPDLDGLDFSGLAWKRGSYDQSALNDIIASNTSRAYWVLSQLDRYVNNIHQIRALGFCVSIAHADFMAAFCRANQINAIALSADSPTELRKSAQRQLEQREINIIFTVDLYNEGVDIPTVDTVLFLRPTESLTIFLQQLGRGLRLHEEKAHLTVLDFIAPQHRNFSYAKRFRALTSKPERPILPQVESDLPYLPAGCLVQLEKQAKEHVIQNIRSATNALRGKRLLEELRHLQGFVSLKEMLECLNMESPDELYRKGLPHLLVAEATGTLPSASMPGYAKPLAEGFRRLLLMDDMDIVRDGAKYLSGEKIKLDESNLLLHSVMWGANRPENLQAALRFIDENPGLKHDLHELFHWILEYHVPHTSQRIPDLTGPLSLHAVYTREQILLALGLGTFQKPTASRAGVHHVPHRKLDLFFADINKSEDDFSPTTMYEDYALTDKLFHWQSQSQTGAESQTGQRYIKHQEQGYTPLLFIRNRKQLDNGLTAPYFFAGPLRYQRHEGSKPMSIIWELEHRLPARTLLWARRVA